MNVLILGATGQVGHDVQRVVEGRDGLNAVVLDRTALDLDDLDRIEPVLAGAAPDVVVNCAAYTAVDRAESEAVVAFRRNAYAPEALASACARAGARLVQLSTDYVFDGETDRPYRPEDAPAPLSVYGASKLAGEALIRRRHGDGTLIVRTSSVFGLGAPGRAAGNFVETMLRLSGERDRLRVVSDTVMAPTYSADLAVALVRLVELEAEPGIYHVTNRGAASWHELAVAVVAEAGRAVAVDPIPSADYPTPARRPRYSVLDTGKADALLSPLPSWEDALRRYLSDRRVPDPGAD